MTSNVAKTHCVEENETNVWVSLLEYWNHKEGRVGCVHQNIFTRKVTDIAFTSDFCNNHSHPPRPVPHVSASHTWCRQVLRLAFQSPKSPHARLVPVPCLLSLSEFYESVMEIFWDSLIPRPAIRITRGGLEPSVIARPRRIFPTSLTGDVTSEIVEDDWERGWFWDKVVMVGN